MSETLQYIGTLKGHKDWVTSIAATYEESNLLVSASRDKTILIWELNQRDGFYSNEKQEPGYARRALTGHNGAISDVTISSDGQFALSGSWDKTCRLWNLEQGKLVRSFNGHTSDVNSVAFSSDNRQIVSGSRDKTVKLWNTLAECKYTLSEEMHSDWVSSVRFSPSAKQPLIVSAGWDKLVKVWNLNDCKLRTNLSGHTGPIYTSTISPDGSLCASGGKDGNCMLWDVIDGKHLYSLDAGNTINALTFSPKNYWLCAATDNSIKVWDLENKQVLEEIVPDKMEEKKNGTPWCVSLSWSADGNMLFAGRTDGSIYVYEVKIQE